jgi:hypothetical protein
VLFLLSINALIQAARWALGWDENPAVLGVEQSVSGVTALVAAFGAWQLHRWSARWAALYGAVTGTMIATLGPVLDMPANERSGLWIGTGIVVLVAGGIAWYLHRALAPTK